MLKDKRKSGFKVTNLFCITDDFTKKTILLWQKHDISEFKIVQNRKVQVICWYFEMTVTGFV